MQAKKSIFREAWRDATVTAVIALILALPLVGFRLQDHGGDTSLTLRPYLLLAAVVAVFLGRLLISLRAGSVLVSVGRMIQLPRLSSSQSTVALGIAIVAAILLPVMPFASRYQLDLATTFLIYVMLGWGLNIVVGMAGLLDLGYVAFYAAGAYTLALLSTYFGLGFWEALPIAGLAAATLGVLLGFPVLRLRGDYLAIVTLGFGEIIRLILLNWTEVTGGPNGISGVPRPSFFGLSFLPASAEGQTFSQFFGLAFSPLQRVAWLYYIILALALLTLVFTNRLRRLPIGRSWEALREDEVACQAVGLNTTIVKLSAFALGAMLGGIAGCFFAARQGFVSPESFTFSESAVILAIVVLGGMGSQMGVVIAAAVLVGLPELGRHLAEYRMLLFGVAMVVIMIWRPRGLLAGRRPSVTASIPSSVGAVGEAA
ncbi:high-affinity branched-chain amino acid ABC transporter permease LivM [Mesorhizobium sp. 2RAF21]|uniref:high-affinity branched-chain amino acid ABC transporter permease LivM n=1 Tax=Mesorhizobium sp. 2RAF21 TaxID=3232995 RepID=UPI003F9DC8DF